jgi:hypothetical protein
MAKGPTELLDELLVLVHLLQGLNIHGVDAGLGGLLNVLHITKHAYAELDFGDVGEFHLLEVRRRRARCECMCYLSAETLILLGVVVLQPNLEFNSLSEDLGLPVLVLALIF